MDWRGSHIAVLLVLLLFGGAPLSAQTPAGAAPGAENASAGTAAARPVPADGGEHTAAAESQDSAAVRTAGKTGCIPVGSLAYEDLAFRAGEKLSFVMHYRWGMINSDVGRATITLTEESWNGVPALHCEVSGKTTKLFDLFFKVREDFNSWFTRDGLRPLHFTRNSFEGKYRATNCYVYDPGRSVIIADAWSTTRGQRNLELPWDACTYDLLSLFFLARNMDFSVVTPERRYPMTFAIDDEVYNVHFILYGPETIDVPGLGQVRTIRFGARLLAGEVFKSDTDMTLYISDDENRLPVYFEAPLLVGKASGRMTDWEGLAHPFTALEKKRR